MGWEGACTALGLSCWQALGAWEPSADLDLLRALCLLCVPAACCAQKADGLIGPCAAAASLGSSSSWPSLSTRCCRRAQKSEVPIDYVLGVGGFDLEKVEDDVSAF